MREPKVRDGGDLTALSGENGAGNRVKVLSGVYPNGS